jgi:hypothetical protein
MFVVVALSVTSCVKKNKHYNDVLGEQSSLAPRVMMFLSRWKVLNIQ